MPPRIPNWGAGGARSKVILRGRGSNAPSVPVTSPPHAATQLAKLGGLLGLSPVAERGLGTIIPPDDGDNVFAG